jgi:CheY-like chemotaxis protein/nitrogen-specific signal transduction histidine kinase
VLTATPLNADGVTGLCLVVTDLTDRDARIAAEAANTAKDRFLAVLSHELRTPLTPVVMMAASMQLDGRLPADVREDLGTIRRNVELETRLIDDLLDVSRVITGKLRLRRAPVEVRGLIHSVMDMVTSDVNQKSLEVRYQWRARSDRVNGDSARLQQVIWNVIKNAIKFSNPSGLIEIRLSNPDDRTLEFQVRDHGIGIDAAVLPDIFNAFEQGDGTAARRSGGLGLGLSIARSVVEMHGGTIRADSGGQATGTTLVITLPLTSLPAPVPAPVAPAASTDGRGVRVLLVEDHQETADVLAKLLRKFGHDVKVAHSMTDALRLASQTTFDLFISDIGLPDGTGHELMRQMKQKHGIPGVALTGYGMEDDLMKSAEVGFDEHVVKPVDVPHLQDVITRVVARER